MTVQKKYAIDELEAKYPQTSFKKEGQSSGRVVSKTTILAADDDLSIFGVAVLPGNACVADIKVACTEITGGTSYSLGLFRYKADGTIGDLIDVDTFLSAQTMAVAKDRGSEITGISELSLANSDKTIAELAAVTSGLTEKDALYVIAWTATTIGTAAGTIVTIIDFVMP